MEETPFLFYFLLSIQLSSISIANLTSSPVLINNAGVARGKSILDATEKDVRFTFDVNTLAHYWTAKEFVPAMVAANHGMVVTVASFAAFITVPNMTDYGASKAAALSFHEGLTAELKTRYNAPKVRTIVINQGSPKLLFSKATTTTLHSWCLPWNQIRWLRRSWRKCGRGGVDRLSRPDLESRLRF